MRFPGFTDEWKQTTLGELCERIGDGLHGTPLYEENTGYYFINGNNLINGIITCSESTKQVAIDDYLKNDKNLNEKTVLISINGTIGNIARYNGERVMLGKSVAYLTFKTNRDFYYHLISSNRVQNHFKSELTGSTIKNLSLRTIRNTSISYPTIEEQNKISKLLSLIEQRIATQNKIIEHLESLIKGLRERFFKQQILFKSKGSKSFLKWEKIKLGEICNEHQLKNIKNEFNEVFSVAKHKGVINQIEHLGRSFSSKEICHYKLIYPGDLVYTKSPTSEFPFGIIKQNRTGRIGVVSPLYCVFKPNTYAMGYLLHEYFKSAVNTYNYLSPLVQKGAKNTMNINNEDFLNGAKLFLPMDEEEQKRIVDVFSGVDNKITYEKNILEQYEKMKKHLLTNLFI